MEAADTSVPLYNRISFLSIFSSNLDEFFRVRMPAIFAFTSIKAKKTSLRDEYPKDLVQQVQTTIQSHLEEFGRILTNQIIPELRENNIVLYYGDPIMAEHQEMVREYFLSRVLSFLQPVILTESNRSDVFLENNSLYFILDIEAADEPGVHHLALLNIPSDHLPRFIQLPPLEGRDYLLFLDDVIRRNIQEVFPAFIIHGAYTIKLTRDAEMALEDEFTGNIAEKIEKQLEKRETGHSTRLLYESSMPKEVREFVRSYFGLREEELVQGGRYHNLKDLGNLPNPRNNLMKYPDWPAVPHPAFNTHRSVFHTILEKEMQLHLPYHSYNHILRFFNEAAIDPKVREIYVTLYRIAADSHIANALISAARNGKKVTVFVELKARFDEANNLQWSKKMKAAGIRIINSIPGLKVHAKVALVKRWDQDQWQHFSFLATGNLNEVTGRFYSDHVFFTTNQEFSTELLFLFDYLESRMQPKEYGKIGFKHLLVSQFNMINRFTELIDREISFAKEGKPASIIIKLNNLQEREMIARLYEASQAGVKIKMIVRSVCCLTPGIKNQSENIEVIRIVDRFLEHARVFIFHNGGNTEYYMGSADWMNRNLHNRIEVIFPLYDDQLKAEIGHIIDLQLKDNRKAVTVNDLLENIPRNTQEVDGPVRAQEATYEYIKKLSVIHSPVPIE